MITEKVWRVRLTLDAPMLGSVPANEQVFTSFKLKKSVDAAKKLRAASLKAAENGTAHAPIATVTGDDFDFEAAEIAVHAPDPEGITGRSVFLRDVAGRPLLSNHVIKGFFKAAARARHKQGGLTRGVSAHIQTIDLHLFINPRMIVLNTSRAESVEPWLERSLRAQTPQGERVTLKASEQVGPGTYLDFEIVNFLPKVVTEDVLREWLDYGAYHGLGEWRNNSNYGCFSYTLAAK